MPTPEWMCSNTLMYGYSGSLSLYYHDSHKSYQRIGGAWQQKQGLGSTFIFPPGLCPPWTSAPPRVCILLLWPFFSSLPRQPLSYKSNQCIGGRSKNRGGGGGGTQNGGGTPSSVAMACIPANRSSVIKGIHCHESISTMLKGATLVSVRKGIAIGTF